MSGTTGLSPSDIVKVSSALSPVATPTLSFGAAMVVGYSPVIPFSQRYRQYSGLLAVGNDFGNTAPEYLAAAAYFAQSPQPSTLFIGRWAKSAAGAQLVGGILSSAQQAALLTTLLGVTNGTFASVINGTATLITGLNFSSIANLNGAAAVITTALAAAGAAATCTWSATTGQFIFSSTSTAASSQVSYLGSTGSGTDVSTPLSGTQALGAVQSAYQPAEQPVAAVQALDSATAGWYGATFALVNYSDMTSAQHLTVSSYVEGASRPHIYGITSNDTTILNSATQTDIAALAQAAGYTRTTVQYSSSSLVAVASLFGRAFTVNFGGQNTVITLWGKQEPGITAETLTESQSAAAISKNCNVFVNYSNGASLIQPGTMASGIYFDTRMNVDWQMNDLLTSVFNLLYLSTTKIPQTDGGAAQIAAVCAASMRRGVNNGIWAAGIWNSSTLFGTLTEGQTLTAGFYIYVAPVASLSAAQLQSRIAPTIQIAAIQAGAFQGADVLLNITTG